VTVEQRRELPLEGGPLRAVLAEHWFEAHRDPSRARWRPRCYAAAGFLEIP
jgi:hypothetical protein